MKSFTMMTLLTALIGQITFLGKAWACTCLPIDANVAGSLENSREVFLGIPIASRDLRENDEDSRSIGRKETTFQVIASFKGGGEKFLKVRSRVMSAACGIIFPDNSGLYLVFAYGQADGSERGLHTSLCSASLVHPQNLAVTKTLKELSDLTHPTP